MGPPPTATWVLCFDRESNPERKKTVSSYLRRPIVADVWLGQTMSFPHFLNRMLLPDPVHWTDLICLSGSNYWFYDRDVQLRIQLFALFTSLPFNPRVYSLFFFQTGPDFLKLDYGSAFFHAELSDADIHFLLISAADTIRSEYCIWKFLVCVVYVPVW